MFLTRNVTADIFSTFTTHLTAATNNFATHARFLQRCVTKFEARFRQKDETYAQRNQRLDLGSRACLFWCTYLHLSRVVYDSLADHSRQTAFL
jgi:hypothetical protein